MSDKKNTVGVIGSGAMGAGIAQVAASAGHNVVVYDNNNEALEEAKKNLAASLKKLLDKEKITADKSDFILKNTTFTDDLRSFKDCSLVIEAIVENLEIKQKVFSDVEKIVSDACVIASNTSSLSITSIASACKHPERVIGIHFFNPATIMPLVEIIPGIASDKGIAESAKKLIDGWGKVSVIAKDTPGFIVNRVARPFYSEALRIYEEGIADMATIDWAMKEIGGFKMGPFELMDLIGHDVNYVVTETVWKQFYYDPRFKPALTQKRLLEAGFLGRKSGKGFYNYAEGAATPEPLKDNTLANQIFNRIIAMLINEATDAVYLRIASPEHIDLAMTKGVNYPKGLLHWCDTLGIENVLQTLKDLNKLYEEDRYRPSLLLKFMAANKKTFY